MPNNLLDATPEQVLARRKNIVYKAREEKLYLNNLVLHGGRPYIDARLCRFPGESSIDWGGTSGTSSKSTWGSSTARIEGRKYRAYLVNHAARIAEKIRQYVFAKPPIRKGNEEMVADITRQGQSINEFMGEALKQLIATKWCWIGIDAPQVQGLMSIQDAKQQKHRPYFTLYAAESVVDWSFDDKGDLIWLMTETEKWDNADPKIYTEPKVVRRLWERGSVTEYEINPKSSVSGPEVVEKNVIQLPVQKVPFVLCGTISDKPHWYDDVEDIQRAVMDLESSIDTLMFKTVFAQMVLPLSMTEEATAENGSTGMQKTVEAIVGLSNAIVETPEDKGITRYIGPSWGSISKMQDELKRKRDELFDVVGLHLNYTKDFSESADSKHFDHLDPQAVLRNYAQQIAEAESKAWKMANELDGSVKAIQPVYSDKFRVSNIYEDFKSLVLADNMQLPDSLRRLNIHGVKDTLLEITNMQLTDEQNALIDKEIEEMAFDEPIELDVGSMAGRVSSGVENQATSFGDEGDIERDDVP